MTRATLIRTAAAGLAATALTGLVCTATASAGNTDPHAPNAGTRGYICDHLSSFKTGRQFRSPGNDGRTYEYAVGTVTDTPQYTRLNLSARNGKTYYVVMTCG